MNFDSDLVLLPGYANAKTTQAYAESHLEAGNAAKGHYSDFLRARLQLSSLGVGTFGGRAEPAVDARIAATVAEALMKGVNVIDTGAHYRYGRSLAAVGAGVRTAIQQGIPREAMFLMSKGGFLTLRGGPPQDMSAWFNREIVETGMGTADDLAKGIHLLSPTYINYQLELSRHLMGVETLDAFLVDQPEVHTPEIGKEAMHQKLADVFEVLERAVQEKRLRFYGMSTFEALRVETDDPIFTSMAAMLGLAERAAQKITGDEHARHHFKIITLPFNQVMSEGFTRFNTATGKGNIASPLQAAYQLELYVMASHTLFKGHLAQQSLGLVSDRLSELSNAARQAMQFNRSTPGLGTSLVGISTSEHLDDMLATAKTRPIPREDYLTLYQKA
ncbi:aldo/keto reductase [Acidihalobacter prosperus]